MTPLPILVPQQLEEAVGWSGDARWISVCWSSCGDAPWIEDGRSSQTATPWAMLAWWRHASVAPHLRHLDLGSSEADGTQRLLLDRQERRTFVADTTEARRVVRDQWPAEPEVELTADQWQQIVEEVRQQMLNRPLPSMEQLVEQLKRNSELVGEMIRFLDARQAEQASE
jgi:hypothetical protein